MTAVVTVEQTATGWHVVATGADTVTVDTDGADVVVRAHPDEPEADAPLQVALA